MAKWTAPGTRRFFWRCAWLALATSRKPVTPASGPGFAAAQKHAQKHAQLNAGALVPSYLLSAVAFC
jgi:hypothetical protein